MAGKKFGRKLAIQYFEELEEVREKQPCKIGSMDIERGMVESLDDRHVLREVDKLPNCQKVWCLTNRAEQFLDNYEGGNMLPCSCAIDGFIVVTAGETIECKKCGSHFSTEVVG